jgi:hypothetical protein
MGDFWGFLGSPWDGRFWEEALFSMSCWDPTVRFIVRRRRAGGNAENCADLPIPGLILGMVLVGTVGCGRVSGLFSAKIWDFGVVNSFGCFLLAV